MEYLSISLCCLQFHSTVLEFSVYKSFASLVKFVARYFILFIVIINGIAFLISLSANSLLAFRNATDSLSFLCSFFCYSESLLLGLELQRLGASLVEEHRL